MLLAVRGHLRRYLTWRPVPVTISIGIGLAALIALSVTFLVRHLDERELDDNTADLATYATMLSAHLESSFTVLEAVQGGVLDQLRNEKLATEQQFVDLMSTAAMHDTMTARVAAIPYVGGLTLVDNHGILVNSTYYWPMPHRDLSDREYFHVLSARDGPDRFVTRPIQNRANGEWTIYIARRITAPDDTFLGVLLGEINFSHFQTFFAQIAPQPDAVVSMFNLDGVMLVRQPPVPGTIGTVQNTGAFRMLQKGLDHGVTRNISPIDHTDRIIAIDRLPHYPIVLSLSRSVDAVLHPWRDQRRGIVLGTVLLELALAISTTLLVRHFRGRERLKMLEASLVKAEIDRALATKSAQFDVAVNAMAQALCMLDASRRLIVSNPQFNAMFGLSGAATQGGASRTALLRAIVRGAAVSIDDIRALKRLLGSKPQVARTLSATWDIKNGRSLLVGVEPMPGQGWLITLADVTERRQAEAQIAHMARHDGLTGLVNRTAFNERLAAALGDAGRGTLHAVLYLDLDYFKTINDTWGHLVGDALLQAAAARIRDCCRDTDVIARLGGDEFAIIQPLNADLMLGSAVAERIIAELTRPFEIGGHQLLVGCSIGIAFAPLHASELDKLLKCADLALYKAKADGRNCYRIFEPALDDMQQQRRVLDIDLRFAVANQEFQIFYQPVVNVRSGRIGSFEALLRWLRPDGSSISPADFIPAAERMGLIEILGQWTLETACREAMTWPSDIAVSVNLSPLQFAGRDLVRTVRDALEMAGLDPWRLQLEITEGLLLDDSAETLAKLHRLKSLGVVIAMDDFGKGYSSLSYLLKFPFDKVKLDRSLVDGAGHSDRQEIVAQSVIAMCDGLGMRTTGEGVETFEQLAFLAKHHCTEAQGFLFSRAVPAKDVPRLIADGFSTVPEPVQAVA